MNTKNYYKPYFEAVKQILEGTPINELDDIRNQCNKAFLMAGSQDGKSPAKVKDYSPEALIISLAADAENRILRGEDPRQVYVSVKGLQPEDLRRRGRLILESCVQRYL
ncbi:MAG: hypothetical protein U9R34_02025 [Nanoarchaeota archaeon]|nr:hypothetical protein [Nanoarchaeota archaeon]